MRVRTIGWMPSGSLVEGGAGKVVAMLGVLFLTPGVGLAQQVYPSPAAAAAIGDRVAALGNIEMLRTFDIYAHLERLSGAVSGPDPLVFALARAGVPVSMYCEPGTAVPGAGTAHNWYEAAVGPVSTDWMEALDCLEARVWCGNLSFT